MDRDGVCVSDVLALLALVGILFFFIGQEVGEYRVTENSIIPETECLVTNEKAFGYVKQYGDEMGYDEASKQAYNLFCAEKEE
jgi:hypothetical protein